MEAEAVEMTGPKLLMGLMATTEGVWGPLVDGKDPERALARPEREAEVAAATKKGRRVKRARLLNIQFSTWENDSIFP